MGVASYQSLLFRSEEWRPGVGSAARAEDDAAFSVGPGPWSPLALREGPNEEPAFWPTASYAISHPEVRVQAPFVHRHVDDFGRMTKGSF